MQFQIMTAVVQLFLLGWGIEPSTFYLRTVATMIETRAFSLQVDQWYMVIRKIAKLIMMMIMTQWWVHGRRCHPSSPSNIIGPRNSLVQLI